MPLHSEYYRTTTHFTVLRSADRHLLSGPSLPHRFRMGDESTIRDLAGCSPDQLRQHIEAQFQDATEQVRMWSLSHSYRFSQLIRTPTSEEGVLPLPEIKAAMATGEP